MWATKHLGDRHELKLGDGDQVGRRRGDLVDAMNACAGEHGDGLVRAQEKLKSAIDRYFTELWANMRMAQELENQREAAEEHAAAVEHANEMHKIIEGEVRERIEDLAEKSKDDNAWRMLVQDYERELIQWEAHVQRLMADRVLQIKGEVSSRSMRLEAWSGDAMFLSAQADALAVHINGLIEQAMSSGDPSSISGPSSVPSGAGSLISAMLAALDGADDAALQRKRAMSPADLDAVLDMFA